MTGSQDGQKSLSSSQPQILSLPMRGVAFNIRAALFPATCLCVLTRDYQSKPIIVVFPVNLIQLDFDIMKSSTYACKLGNPLSSKIYCCLVQPKILSWYSRRGQFVTNCVPRSQHHIFESIYFEVLPFRFFQWIERHLCSRASTDFS